MRRAGCTLPAVWAVSVVHLNDLLQFFIFLFALRPRLRANRAFAQAMAMYQRPKENITRLYEDGILLDRLENKLLYEKVDGVKETRVPFTDKLTSETESPAFYCDAQKGTKACLNTVEFSWARK